MMTKKKIGDLSIRHFKEMKKKCKNCLCLVEDCIRCEQENPNLYALCDIDLDNIEDKDLDQEIEVDEDA